MKAAVSSNKCSIHYLSSLFICTLVLLAAEIMYTRIFSILYWVSVIPLLISIAMLGMGVAGTLMYLLPEFFHEKRKDRLLFWSSILFALSIPVSLKVDFFSAAFANFKAPTMLFSALLISIIATSLPFFFGGLFVTLNIFFFKEDIGRVYFADLLGAGVGCLVSLLVLDWIGGVMGLLALAALGALPALIIALNTRSRFSIGISAAVIVLTVICIPQGTPDAFIGIKYAKGRDLNNSPDDIIEWSSLGRVRLHNGKFRIDESVNTVILDVDDEKDIEPLRSSVMTSAYHLKKNGSVLIIGSGAGIDIWRAHWAGSRKITAVEINPGIVRIMKGPMLDRTGRVYALDELEVHCDEGRSFISHTDDVYDVIQVSFVDTFTAGGTEASALAENGLYTVEAFQDYWQHLKQDGILTFTRWGGRVNGMSEIERSCSLAVDMMLRQGIREPWKHIIALRNPAREHVIPGSGYDNMPLVGDISALMVKKIPFSSEEIARVEQVVDEFRQRPLFIPASGRSIRDFARIVTTSSLKDLRQITDAEYQKEFLDISPPTDDRPYFFSFLKPLDFLPMQKKFPDWMKDAVRMKLYMGVNVLRFVISVLFLLALVSIAGPLLARLNTIKGIMPGMPMLLYFCLLGLGFIFIEISAINQFAIFLGHPIYSLAAGLFSILVFAGLGSLVYSKIRMKHHFILLALIVCLGLAAWKLYPLLIEGFMHLDTAGRVFVTVISLAPLCFIMGMALPMGVDMLGKRNEEVIPWAFALNGVFSVTGSALAMAMSLQSGFSSTFLVGPLCYAGAAACVLVFSRMNRV